jgi:hypothetical protein
MEQNVCSIKVRALAIAALPALYSKTTGSETISRYISFTAFSSHGHAHRICRMAGLRRDDEWICLIAEESLGGDGTTISPPRRIGSAHCTGVARGEDQSNSSWAVTCGCMQGKLLPGDSVIEQCGSSDRDRSGRDSREWKAWETAGTLSFPYAGWIRLSAFQ